MPYLAEYTDTFGGETNYSWVRRAVVHDVEGVKLALRRARAELGLTGVKGDITASYGDELHWTPRGSCTVLMVRWCDREEANSYS
jgi:hypothetical protein